MSWWLVLIIAVGSFGMGWLLAMYVARLQCSRILRAHTEMIEALAKQVEEMSRSGRDRLRALQQ